MLHEGPPYSTNDQDLHEFMTRELFPFPTEELELDLAGISGVTSNGILPPIIDTRLQVLKTETLEQHPVEHSLSTPDDVLTEEDSFVKPKRRRKEIKLEDDSCDANEKVALRKEKNRKSSQLSRERKRQYDLERENYVSQLEGEVMDIQRRYLDTEDKVAKLQDQQHRDKLLIIQLNETMTSLKSENELLKAKSLQSQAALQACVTPQFSRFMSTSAKDEGPASPLPMRSSDPSKKRSLD